MDDDKNTDETPAEVDGDLFDDHADDEDYDISDVEIVEEEEGRASDE